MSELGEMTFEDVVRLQMGGANEYHNPLIFLRKVLGLELAEVAPSTEMFVESAMAKLDMERPNHPDLSEEDLLRAMLTQAFFRAVAIGMAWEKVRHERTGTQGRAEE